MPQAQRIYQLDTDKGVLAYRIRFSPRKKSRISIVVKQGGEVEVSSPLGVAESELHQLVKTKTDWIWLQLGALPPEPEVKHYTPGCQITYLGESFTLSLSQKTYLDRETRTLYLKAGRDIETSLYAWYRKCARELFTQRLVYWSDKVPWVHSVPELKVTKMRRRWGSYSSKGWVNLNLHLIKAPLPVLDQVIAHELCHVKEMNHSRAFYALLEQVYPGWQQARDTLNRISADILR